MSEDASSPVLRRNLRCITADGATFSVMVGIGETYLPAFVLAMGLGELAAGLIAAVPMLGGAVLQLLAPLGVRRLGSLRKWVVLCAAAQALTFVPLVLAAVCDYAPAWFVFPVATLYWALGMATGPAWNTWVTRLIPARLRAPYFARRTRIAQICLLVSMLVGGLTLHAMAKSPYAVLTFAVLFSVASLARLSSTRFLAAQSETKQDVLAHRRVLPWELLRRAGRSADGTLLFYMLGVQLMAQVAGPFFTPYMLERLTFPYAAYTAVIATAFLAKIAVLPLLGHFATRFGARRLLRLGGLAVIPLSALWVVSDSFAYLLVVQVLAGMAWGAYELATLLLLFESIREDERTSVLTAFNLLNALATVGGALLGGVLLKALFAHANAYHVLFLASGVGRLFTLIPLLRVHDMKPEPRPISIRTVAVRPSVGSIDSPVLSSIANGHDDEAEPGYEGSGLDAAPVSGGT